jgi:hypothetical protein
LAHVQSAFSTAGGATGQSSWTISCSALGVGNIVTGATVFVLDSGTTLPTLTITDNAGTPNTYLQLDTPGSSGRFVVSFALKIPSGGGGGTTLTVSSSATCNSTQIWLDEWSGYGYVGNHGFQNSSAANPATTGSLTSVSAGALYWGAFINSAGVDTPAPGSGFTGLIDANDAFWNPRTEYLIQSSPGSLAVTATNSAANFVIIVGIILEVPAVPIWLYRVTM